MAAIDRSSTNVYPVQSRDTLSAVVDTMQEYLIPAGARKISILFESNAAKFIAQGGTDGGVIAAENYLKIPADTLYFHNVPQAKRAHSIWVAPTTGSTVVTIQIDEEV